MPDILIKAGRLFDGVSDATRERAFVAVQGGKIAAVGGQSELGATGEANYGEVIDLGDHVTLMPGLINMHTHMSFKVATA